MSFITQSEYRYITLNTDTLIGFGRSLNGLVPSSLNNRHMYYFKYLWLFLILQKRYNFLFSCSVQLWCVYFSGVIIMSITTFIIQQIKYNFIGCMDFLHLCVHFCMQVCVCALACMCVCVFVCVYACVGMGVCVCVCMCVRERERDRTECFID